MKPNQREELKAGYHSYKSDFPKSHSSFHVFTDLDILKRGLPYGNAERQTRRIGLGSL